MRDKILKRILQAAMLISSLKWWPK